MRLALDAEHKPRRRQDAPQPLLNAGLEAIVGSTGAIEREQRVDVGLAHLTAIVVPIVGATLWDTLGYRFPFLFGTIFVFGSLYFTQKIDVEKQRAPSAPVLATASD